MGGNGIQHILHTTRDELGGVLRGYGPARCITAVDTNIRHVVLVQCRPQDFDKLGGLVAVAAHGGVGGRIIRLIEEADVGDFNGRIGGGIELNVFDEVVRISLLPVAGFAGRSCDLNLLATTGGIFALVHQPFSLILRASLCCNLVSIPTTRFDASEEMETGNITHTPHNFPPVASFPFVFIHPGADHAFA